MFFRLALAGTTVALALPLAAQWKDWDYQLDREIKPWAELQTQLPAYPKDENLLRFDMGSATANRFFIDARSLSVGEDGVVRYALVIKAAGGATNVTFEGIRCNGRQVRIYASGHANGQWSRARNTDWRDIQLREINGYHHTLHRDYFCWTSNRTETFTLKEIMVNLKRGPQHPADGLR
ncbi:MAG: hypothetical protein FJY56_05505 [Betaproteobacteria bacterium]|nr:hypothetical protein [Betaproteobacteria bacterium]